MRTYLVEGSFMISLTIMHQDSLYTRYYLRRFDVYFYLAPSSSPTWLLSCAFTFPWHIIYLF